jgi:surfactin synthase thioesterase subunit
MEKTNDECGKTMIPGNHFFLTKKVEHCLLLLGGILPQLKI